MKRCSSSIVSNTKSKGIFRFQDPAGSFGATLITNITPGPFTVNVKHSLLK
ncbi:hypothetical protein [Alkalibaculum bacchi]|nr:hypothetical protein [Alkalibaculum bacchi]